MRALKRGLSQLLTEAKGYQSIFILLLTYSSWLLIFRLLVLTLMTYFLMSSSSQLQDISEVFSTNSILVTSLGTFLFLLVAVRLNPITSFKTADIVSPGEMERRFIPGFLQGAVLALGLVMAFLLSGHYRYLGVFIDFDEAALAMGAIVLRGLALIFLTYSEEFIFRRKILGDLCKRVRPVYAVIITSILYCFIKGLQFDLGIMHLTTLYLFSVFVSIRAINDRDFIQGAGFIAGLLLIIHPMLGLPIFGSEFPGLLLIKFNPDSSTSRFLTGGVGGPLSSFAIQFFLILQIVWGLYKNKNFLLKTSGSPIK